MAKDTFWGLTLYVSGYAVASLPVLAVAVTKGAIDAANGKSFSDGFNGVCDSIEPAMDAIKDFGDAHSKEITGVVTAVIAGSITRDGYNEVKHGLNNLHHHNPPPSA